MQALLVLHVFANTIWIGALVASGLMIGGSERTKEDANGQLMAALGLSLYRFLAVPAFVLSFVAGAGRLLGDVQTYMSLHWMHAKLLGAVAVIALHHMLGARARRAAAHAGSRQATKSSAILTGATMAFAFVTVTFAVLKGQLVP